MYDPSVGRFTTQDRFSEKYFDFSPYQYAANNPVLFVDVNGDSVSFTLIKIYDKTKGTNVTQQLVDELNDITGLSLSVDEDTGWLTYEKNEDGSAVVSNEDGVNFGSETARNELINAIDGDDIVSTSISPRSMTAGNFIGLSPEQINSFVEGTPLELNKGTLGLGMTFLHEYKHTDAGGGLKDPSDRSDTKSTGDVVDAVNIYRNELDQNPTTKGSGQYGQRLHYIAEPSETGTSVRFKYQSTNKKGKKVSRTTKIKF